jgi:WD40 repeat protein/transcriptional regulator with XRE-family HTH domain
VATLRDDDGPRPGRVATQQDFGRELSLARQRAGLTIREVARVAGLPASTAGDYFSGRHLPPPSQPGLLPEILRACGETDPARVSEWTSALGRARRSPGRRVSRSRAPYRGLASFQPADAPWFFGRQELTDRLVALATEGAAVGNGQAARAAGLPLAVVGPSGSGKSSLLRAGLIPRLAGPLALLTPAADPVAGLAVHLSQLTAAGAGPYRPAAELAAALRRDPAGAARLALPGQGGPRPGPASRPVIVVDQFEAIFTACPDEDQRRAFISAICALSGPAVVVIALRADFYDRALRHAGLAAALQERQVVLGPMSPEQVRSAIVEPARLMRLHVEDGLVEVLLRDLAPRTAGGALPGAAHEAGALPLLSHALLATWEHSRGGRLTVADYQASGGIRDAIARTAEKVYADLAGDQQDMTRRLFLRLVNVADDAPETRSTVRLSDLPGLQGGPAQNGTAASDLLGRFVAGRLITMDADTAQISHEALLTAWPRLRAWIDTDHENLRIRRRASEAARAWAEAGRDDAALLRGSRLAVARDWAAEKDNRDSLDRLAREFVDASAAQEKIRQQAERNRTRRLHRLVAALTALVLVTIGLSGYAFRQRQAASAATDAATTARDSAQSRAVAVEADQVRAQDVSLAAQLGLAAYRIAGTPAARASLLESSGTPMAARLADSAGVVQAVSLSPSHRVLAVAAADGTLRLWDVARTGRPAAIGSPLTPKSKYPLYAVVFSPDGKILAAAGAGKRVTLWNVSNPAHPVPLKVTLTGPTKTVYSLAFSPGGRVLAAGSADDTVRLWTVAARDTRPLATRPLATLTGAAGYVESVAFSPDGRTLAAGSADKTVRLWDVAGPARPRELGKPLAGPAATVTSVAFSPDGRMLAAGSQDDKVWLWNVARRGRAARAGPPLAGATDWVNTVAFSPDGTSLAAGSSDASAAVWNLATRSLTATLPLPQPVTSLAWDGTGHLITGEADGTARLWTLPSPVLAAGGPVNSVAFSRAGLLAVGAADLQLWNPVARGRLAAVPVPGPAPLTSRFVNAVAFAPGGKVLAAGYGDGMIQLWRVAGPGTLSPLGRPVRASGKGLVESVAFSRDGNELASGSDDGTVRLWSVSNPASPRPLATVHDAGINIVFSVAFSPDGRTLVAASSNDLTRLWDVADPARPAPLGSPLSGPASYAISVAFSPDGRTLAVGSADKTVRLWDVSDPARPVRLGEPLAGPTSYVYSVAFSPDGKTLAAGDTDGTAWLWNIDDPARPALLATLTGPAGHVYSVAFGPGGRTLAAGSADGTVRIWDTSPRTAADSVCATAGQPLTRREWASYVPGLRYDPPCRNG